MALITARATIQAVKQNVDAHPVAHHAPWRDTVVRRAGTLIAVRGRLRANVSAGAAVVGIRMHGRADPAASDGTLDAIVNARAIKAFAILEGSRVITPRAAASAVVEVVGEIGAVVSTTGLSKVAAVVATGTAVRVGPQVAALSIASRS